MPVVRPFRALRYRPESVGDLAAVVCPPYDVIGPDEQRRLLARHERNIVRLDLPAVEPGDEPDDRYRRAARTLAAWRSDGTLHRDPRPALYVHEQAYRVPGTAVERVQRGFFARLRLEPLGPETGVRPHERTLAAPREDRYRLLRATGVNTSPVVVLYRDRSGDAATALETLTAGPPIGDVRDDDGVRHRLWVVPDEGDADGPVRRLVDLLRDEPVTIADGHHRYETALRYRDERRMTRSCEEDPAFDYLLSLFLDAQDDLTVLPTHRLVTGLDGDDVESLWRRLPERFGIEDASRERLVAEFSGAALRPGGAGRFGLWTPGHGAILQARDVTPDGDPAAAGGAVGRLDVTRLAGALEALLGIDAATVASGERIRYTKSAAEALDLVDGGAAATATATAGSSLPAAAAFLLEPTPVEAILDVAAAGDVMPQKSTYFYPKALTGLVINPLEW